MSNVISAIINLLDNPIIELKREYISSRNRANSMGEALEEYIKDLFAGTVNELDENKRMLMFSDTFSYLGNQNNPPDSILKYGDAIEVKKIQSPNSWLALNSSYPKAKLYSTSSLINEQCRFCETSEIEYSDKSSDNSLSKKYWREKDIIYITGVVNDKQVSSLAFVYGVDFAASQKTYTRIRDKIKEGIHSLEDVEFSETNEIGRVNKVDPLGITYLRIRGMWGITNPFVVFNYLFERDFSKKFNFMAIINNEKWETFDNRYWLIKKIEETEGADFKEVNIKNPDNPADLKKAKLITFIR